MDRIVRPIGLRSIAVITITQTANWTRTARNAGFFWGHVGWLVLERHDLDRGPLMDQYAKDLRRDPFQAWLAKHDNWIFVMFASWVLFFAAGFGFAALTGSSIASAAQFGLSLVIWGAAVRTVVNWHLTWIVNSADHLWGYRNYDTPDCSRNSVWLGLLCNGDGWHNNHHADPRSARHGHMWWEFDLAWVAIRLMMALGLAKDAALPSPSLAASFSDGGPRSGSEGFVPLGLSATRDGEATRCPGEQASHCGDALPILPLLDDVGFPIQHAPPSSTG